MIMLIGNKMLFVSWLGIERVKKDKEDALRQEQIIREMVNHP